MEKRAKRQRGKICVAMYCSNSSKNGKSCFSWPREAMLRRVWTRFVQRRRGDFKEPDPSNKSSVLCQDHFVDLHFANKMQVDLGFQKSLQLKPGAVPTLLSYDDPLRAQQEKLGVCLAPLPPTSAQRKLEANRVIK